MHCARLAAVVEEAPHEPQLRPVIFRDDAGDRRRAHVAADHDEPRAVDLARRAIADKRRAVEVQVDEEDRGLVPDAITHLDGLDGGPAARWLDDDVFGHLDRFVVGAGRHDDAVAGVRGPHGFLDRGVVLRHAARAPLRQRRPLEPLRELGAAGLDPPDRGFRVAEAPQPGRRARGGAEVVAEDVAPSLRRHLSPGLQQAQLHERERGHVAVAPRQRRAGGAPDEAQQRRRRHVRRRHLTRCIAWNKNWIGCVSNLATVVAIRSGPGAAAGPQPSYFPFCSAAPIAINGGRPHAGGLHGGQIRRDDAYDLVREEAEPALRAVGRVVALGGAASQLAREGLEGLALVLHL